MPRDFVLSIVIPDQIVTSPVVPFLEQSIGRFDLTATPQAAVTSTCQPALCSVFPYAPVGVNGYSADTLTAPGVSDPIAPGVRPDPDNASGATFRDRALEYVFRWTPPHELGHTFGRWHVEAGVDRIIYQPKDSDTISVSALYTYLAGPGEPSFTLEEAKTVWNSLVEKQDASVFETRP